MNNSTARSSEIEDPGAVDFLKTISISPKTESENSTSIRIKKELPANNEDTGNMRRIGIKLSDGDNTKLRLLGINVGDLATSLISDYLKRDDIQKEIDSILKGLR